MEAGTIIGLLQDQDDQGHIFFVILAEQGK